MTNFACGHESTDEGRSHHVIEHDGVIYTLCNACAESFDYDNPPTAEGST